MDLDKIFRPQPSERWAMYRLICPVVDDACAKSGLEPYFEFSSPNGPNRRLSADIALMQGDRPVWLIEAKKYSRKVDPGMIEAYLKKGVMGAVSNGNYWVFKVDGRFLELGPLLGLDGRIEKDAYAKITCILSSSSEEETFSIANSWSDIWESKRSSLVLKPWIVSGGKGERSYHVKTRFDTLAEAVTVAREKTLDETMAAILLNDLLLVNKEQSIGYWEVNEERMVWWLNERVRGARLNLKGKQLELLVHNALIGAVGRENIRASLKMHDKNTAMTVIKASSPEEITGLSSLFLVNTRIVLS